jgi:hypothetical protein
MEHTSSMVPRSTTQRAQPAQVLRTLRTSHSPTLPPPSFVMSEAAAVAECLATLLPMTRKSAKAQTSTAMGRLVARPSPNASTMSVISQTSLNALLCVPCAGTDAAQDGRDTPEHTLTTRSPHTARHAQEEMHRSGTIDKQPTADMRALSLEELFSLQAKVSREVQFRARTAERARDGRGRGAGGRGRGRDAPPRLEHSRRIEGEPDSERGALVPYRGRGRGASSGATRRGGAPSRAELPQVPRRDKAPQAPRPLNPAYAERKAIPVSSLDAPLRAALSGTTRLEPPELQDYADTLRKVAQNEEAAEPDYVDYRRGTLYLKGLPGDATAREIKAMLQEHHKLKIVEVCLIRTEEDAPTGTAYALAKAGDALLAIETERALIPREYEACTCSVECDADDEEVCDSCTQKLADAPWKRARVRYSARQLLSTEELDEDLEAYAAERLRLAARRERESKEKGSSPSAKAEKQGKEKLPKAKRVARPAAPVATAKQQSSASPTREVEEVEDAPELD